MRLQARRWIGCAAIGMLALGCLGKSPTRPARLFVLEAVAAPSSEPKRDLSIGVGPVTLPRRLDRPQIVTRSGENEVELAEFEQWAEPLERSFARAVAENLARSLPTDRVAVYPWTARDAIEARVAIDVARFEREANGNVTLAARWNWIEGERVEHRSSTLTETPDGPGPEALVAAMSRAVGALCGEIADALRARPR